MYSRANINLPPSNALVVPFKTSRDKAATTSACLAMLSALCKAEKITVK